MNTTRLSCTSGQVMANEACLAVVIEEVGKTGPLIFVKFPRVGYFFFVVVVVILFFFSFFILF